MLAGVQSDDFLRVLCVKKTVRLCLGSKPKALHHYMATQWAEPTETNANKQVDAKLLPPALKKTQLCYSIMVVLSQPSHNTVDGEQMTKRSRLVKMGNMFKVTSVLMLGKIKEGNLITVLTGPISFLPFKCSEHQKPPAIPSVRTMCLLY